jgi:hypothetical protein
VQVCALERDSIGRISPRRDDEATAGNERAMVFPPERHMARRVARHLQSTEENPELPAQADARDDGSAPGC